MDPEKVAANLDRQAHATLSLNETLRRNATDLYSVPLQRLNCSFDVVSVAIERESSSLRDLVREQARKNRADLVIVYAVRQPGCFSCREHAMQLVELAQSDRRVHLMGIVKETGVADDVLLEFYQEYFGRHALYKDDKWKVYKAMGNKKLSLKQLILGFFRSQRRFREKNIQVPNMKKGDSWLQGGMMMFDRSGDFHFAYNTEFQEIDMDLIGKAMTEARRQYRANKRSPSTTMSSSSSTAAGSMVEGSSSSFDETRTSK